MLLLIDRVSIPIPQTVWMPGRFRCVYINLPAEPGADDYVVKACNSNQRLSDASSLDDTVRHVFASLHHVRMPRGLESESRSMLISAPCAEDIVGIDTATSTTTGIASGSQSPPPSEAKRRSSKWDDSGPSPLVCYALRLWPGEELKGALAEFATNRAIRVREMGPGDGDGLPFLLNFAQHPRRTDGIVFYLEP